MNNVSDFNQLTKLEIILTKFVFLLKKLHNFFRIQPHAF